MNDRLTDLAEAGPVQQPGLLRLGKKRWDSERPQRLAGEAVTGQATLPPTLPDEVIERLWLWERRGGLGGLVAVR